MTGGGKKIYQTADDALKKLLPLAQKKGLIPKAKAYIGPKSSKNIYGDPMNQDKTKVKLLKVKSR